MVKISDKHIDTAQAYSARGIIGKLGILGQIDLGHGLITPIYKFLTLDAGKDNPSIAVEFVKPAPILLGDDGDSYLDVEKIEPGMFVVNPGLLYKKIPMFDNLMAVHLKALKRYKRKDIITYEKEDAPAIDLGFKNFSSEKITTREHEKRTIH